MDRTTKWKVFISSVCFLAFIYVLASFEQGTRKQVEEDLATMTDSEVEEESFATPKTMYLTFDDGPSKNTEKVLDILDKYSIKATFFVTGENEEFSPMIKTIHERGHTLGLHTYSHEYSSIYKSTDAYFDDLQKIHALVLKESGVDSHILRFPGGSSNTISRNYGNGIMSMLTKEVEAKGYQYYDWNAHNGDGDPGLSGSTLYKKALKDIEGKDEVMMLMHDGAGNEHTVETLDKVLQELVRQGWTFKTIDQEGMPVFHHTVAN